MILLQKNTLQQCGVALVFYLLFFGQGFCQQNLVIGGIITNSQDTLKGYIDDRGWNINPSAISFTQSLDEPTTSYSPSEIGGVIIGDQLVYLSQITLIDITPIKDRELKFSPKQEVVKETVFLKLLVEGQIQLLYLKDQKQKDHFFIRQGSSSPEELIFIRYLIEDNGSIRIASSNIYKDQLLGYLDHPSMKRKIGNAKYTHASLTQLFQTYHALIGETDSEILSSREKALARFGLLIGGNLTRMTFEGDVKREISQANYTHHPGIYAGGIFELVFPTWQQKLSLYNEVSIKYYRLEGMYEQPFSSYTGTTEFDLSELKILNILRYRYPITPTLKFNVGGGVSSNFTLKKDNSLITSLNLTPNSPVQTAPAFQDEQFKNYDLGFVGFIGLSSNKLLLDAKIESNSGISELSLLSSRTIAFYLSLGYYIN